jgi:saccharopine dehydrogenase (NADP+, L-glutamate forming)
MKSLPSAILPSALSDQLDKICSFQVGELDLVMLQHKFVVEWKD